MNRDLEDFVRRLFSWIGQLTEWLADRSLDHEARHGSQVLAVALGSREVFVSFRDQVYLLSAEDAGPLLPGHMLSQDERRALFGPKGDAREEQRLTGRAWAGIEVLTAGESGAASLCLKQADGRVRRWTLASTSAAEDLGARLGGPLGAGVVPESRLP
jgi:hypothetical protein